MSYRQHSLIFLFMFALTGCNQQDTGALARIATKVQHRGEALTGKIGANTISSVAGVSDPLNNGLEGRVALRLRWDRELAGSAIEVIGITDGVELRGQVRSLEQRRRALMLAESTAGVTAVVDSLVESRQ